MAFLVVHASADPSQEAVEAARSECRDAFLARDAEAYMDAAASMIAWGSLQNPVWMREVELFLAFAEAIEGASFETAGERAAALSNGGDLDSEAAAPVPPTDVPTADTCLADYLARLQADEADVDAVVREIAADLAFVPSPGPERDALEAALTAHGLPIPAAQSERNLVDYQALAKVCQPLPSAYAGSWRPHPR